MDGTPYVYACRKCKTVNQLWLTSEHDYELLQDDEPLSECRKCGAKYWSLDEIGEVWFTGFTFNENKHDQWLKPKQQTLFDLNAI